MKFYDHFRIYLKSRMMQNMTNLIIKQDRDFFKPWLHTVPQESSGKQKAGKQNFMITHV